jgi:RNA polymerase sigma factor (sigma-70 family)
MASSTDSSAGTRTSLLRNVSDPTQGTRWEEFDQTYRGIVFGMARRAGFNHHDSEDITQEVFRDLARSLGGFEVRDRPGCFRRYLFNLVRWRIGSRFERQKLEADRALQEFAEETDADTTEDVISRIPSKPSHPESSEADFREVVTQAMMALSKDLAARHVQVLELYFCREWPAKRVASALGMPAASVFTIAHRHKLRLMREVLCRM